VGNTLRYLKRNEEVLVDYEQAIQLSPEDGMVYCQAPPAKAQGNRI
jgi:hypothetical protein